MAKMERKWYAQFLSPPGVTENWTVLGIDNDDLKKELSPRTETKKNVLGETAFVHNGYEVQVAVEPYYADKDSPLYAALRAIIRTEANSEEKCLGKYADVFFDAYDEVTKTFTGEADVQDAWIVPQSSGGDTSGVQIPFNVYPVGPKTLMDISYSTVTRTPTFTAPEP